jgi:hypothetical protein
MTSVTSTLKPLARITLAAIALTAWSARAATVYGVRIQEQGIIECQTLESYKPAETGGNSGTYSGCRVKEATQYVTARVGKHYGCFYEVVGSPDGELVQMEHRFVIPKPGAVNPTTQEHFLVFKGYENYKIGLPGRMIAWRPDHAGELVAGEWILEIRYQDRLLGSCVFHIST